MQRHRDLAGSPVRSASEVWTALSQLVIDTIIRSPHIPESQVTVALAAAAPAGIMLTAAGHLERDAVVLVAGDLHLTIRTVSEDKAFSVEENLNPVPGAANAQDWTLHLPTPEPIGEAISELTSGVAHLSTDEPNTVGSTTKSSAATSVPGAPASALNLNALARRQANQ